MIFTFVMMGTLAAPAQAQAPQPIARPPIAVFRKLAVEPINLSETAPQPDPKQPNNMKPAVNAKGPPAFEVHTTDESTIRVVILDSTIELNTNFGQLVLPMKDIRRMEIGVRLTDEDEKKVQAALAKLTDTDRKARLLGREAVLTFPGKSLPAVRRAKKTITDPEILSSLADVETRLTAALRDKNEKEIMDRDMIRTENSTFVGMIVAKQFKVQTGPFGEQQLKLVDLRTARNLSPDADEEEGELVTLPATGMNQFQGQFGKVYRIRVTGTINGNIWGTGTYTLDSYLPMAAVHAGAIKLGETAIVKVKIVNSPNFFAGGHQNGVNSANYGQFPQGAYEFILKKSE